MSIVSCPRCGDKVSVPPAASSTALVQCPLCCEEYFLSDALIQLPPMLRVVGGHAAAADKDVDYRLAEPVAAAVGERGFDALGDGGTAVASRPQLRTVPRPRRPEKSAVGEIVKVVLGGAAGLAGGLLVLWWGFGVDVGELGPKLSKVEYLRFLVPQKLWDQSVRSEQNASQFESAVKPQQAQKKGSQKSTGGLGGVAADSAEVATDPADSRAVRPDSTKKGDPFLTLDDLGSEPATTPPAAGDLILDDPLSALETPVKNKAQGKADPFKEPIPAETSEENPVEPAKADGKPGDDDAAPPKDNPADEKNPNDEPAGEKVDGEKKDTDEEANPK